MATVKTDERNYQNIANAIREKTGSQETFTPGEMDAAILSIPTGGSGGSGLTEEVKQALLDCFENVAWSNDNGQMYYDALHDIFYPPVYVENFIRVGNPTIENGILTPSSDSWIETSTAFSGADPWMLTTKIYRPRLLGAYENLLKSDGFKLQTPWQSRTVVPYFYDADGNNIFPNGGLSKSVDSEAWTWLKVGWNGERYDIGVSADGSNYLWSGDATEPFGTIYSRPSTTPIKSGVLQIGTSNTAAQFDLKETKIEINGEVWWTPYVRG